MKLIKLFSIFAPIILLLVSLLLIYIWFKSGDFLATGEDGLILYNPARSLKLYNSSWTEIGTGMVGSIFRPLLPLTYLELKLTDAGVSINEFQQIMFFLLMAIGAISVYYLAKELLQLEIGSPYIYEASFIASMFYIFNPISMLGVWFRFIYSFIFLYALAPLFFLVYLKGLKAHKLKYTILVSLITLPFCYAFGSPAMISLVWVLPTIYTCLFITKNNKFFPILFLLTSLVLFSLVNLWWMIPMKDYFSGFSSGSSTNDLVYNINTLKSNSQDFTLNNVIRLIHGGFLYRGEAFGPIYKSLPFILLSWVLPGVSLFGILKIRDKFLKKFLIVSALTLIFLAKGTSLPLGEIQIFLFKVFPPMQLYRNSMEKWGLLLPTILMLIFAIGFIKLISISNSKIKKLILVVLLVSYFFIFHWPMVTGEIVGYKDRKIAVDVPKSFEEVNKVIGGSHRLMSFPMTGGASGKYTWNKAFQGHEASEYLFESPSISKAFGGDSYSELFVKLSHDNSINPIIKAQLFGANMVVLRKDLDLKGLGLPDDAFKKSQEMIASASLELILDYPEFSIFKVPDSKVVPIIFSPQSVMFVDSIPSLLDMVKQNKIDLQKSIYICDSKVCIPNVAVRGEDFDKLTTPHKITFTKISPSEYSANVLGNKGKFILAFLQNYHPNWKIRINDHQLNESGHFVANGFGNGFLIDEKGENLDIEIYFVSEQAYNQLYKISAGVIIFLSVLLFILLLKHEHTNT